MIKNANPMTGKNLSEQEMMAILKSPETLATYLASLNPEQVRESKKLLFGMDMDGNVKKALSALLDLTEKEAIRNEGEYRKKILPKVENLVICMKLWEQIKEIEALEASI